MFHNRKPYYLATFGMQFTAVAFFAFSYSEGFYSEPFVILFSFLFAFLLPSVFLVKDIYKLRKKIKIRTTLNISQLIYYNDQDEAIKIMEAEKYVDTFIRPRADDFPIEDIVNEIRVERLDTTKNILRQLEAARKRFEENDLNGALDCYRLIEKIFNRSPSLYFNMGNIYYLKSDFTTAAKFFERGIECSKNREFDAEEFKEKISLLYYNLANACFLLKKYPKAIEMYKQSITLNSNNDNAFFNLAFCHAMDYEDTGSISEAVWAFKNIISEVPENIHAWFYLGRCLYKKKNTKEAIECFTKVVSEEPSFYEAWYSLANVYDECGMYADAIKAYYTTIQIKPDYIDSYNNLGILLSTIGRHGEAQKVLKNALRIKPSDPELIFNIGVTLFESQKYGEAFKEFLNADMLRPNDDTVLYMIAKTLMKLNSPVEAMKYLMKAVEVNPQIKAKAIKERVFQEYINKKQYSGVFK